MNNHIKLKLCNMVRDGVIPLKQYKEFARRKPNKNSQFKQFIIDCNNFSVEDINQFKIKLLDSWNNVNNTYNSDEIPIIINLLNNGSVMTRKELINKTGLSPFRISNAIEKLIGNPYDIAESGLIEEGIIDVMTLNGNETLVFIRKEKFYSYIKK